MAAEPSENTVNRPGKRAFLKIVVLASAILALLPFSPLVEYLAPMKSSRKKIANVDELSPDSYKIFFYPGDNDPYMMNMLIRLQDGRFRAFNRVCVVRDCLVRYWSFLYLKPWPSIECPCCGSVYRPWDAAPISGPASRIGRGLALVKLEIEDKTGNIYASGIIGEIGFGRYVNGLTDPLEPAKV